MTPQDLAATLRQLAEPRYREFAASLIPGETDLLGVRLPTLRTLARRAARSAWHPLFQALAQEHGMEIVMLRGMLPGYAPHATLPERLAALAAFVPAIRNWSICDSCCTTYRFTRCHRAEVLDFLLPYLVSPQEYEARFAVVMLLLHYVPEAQWAPRVAECLLNVRCPAHYARMAVAWCCCELHLRYPHIAARLIPQLCPELQALTHRKIRESHRHPA
ncbi:MAG: DNA alkylation repair protein [Akkermansia sp.]|nr:DNA alkylation repair protein [Akkermansia sp.]